MEDEHPLTLALRRRAPETNREGWYYQLSDDLGCSYQAVKSWFYGHTVPDRESAEKLFTHYGVEFADEVIHALYGWRVRENGDKSNAQIEEAREWLSQAPGWMQGNVTRLKRA